MRSFFRFKTFAFLLALGGCAPMIDTHGDALDPEKLASLKVGETPYTEVLQILGSPSSRTLFDTENWLYILSKQKRIAFFKPEEFERTVTVLKFNRQGILQQIDFKQLADGRSFTPSAETTPSYGKELSVIDQMISNVGRFEGKTPTR